MDTFFSHVWNTTAELAPWLLLGLAIAGLFHALLPAGLIGRSLRGNAGVFKAVGIGVPLPLCSCGVIPAGIGLKKDGASSGAAVGFLIATPQTGVDSILVSASMLGWPFALVKVVAALTTGLVGGLLVERAVPSEAVSGPMLAGPSKSLKVRLHEGAGHSVEVFRSIWRWLAFGVLMSAALMTLVTPGSLASAFGDSWLLASLAVLAVAIPTYVCATGSVPIAAALVAGGLPLSAALVFLMAGPATSVATIGTIHKHFGRKVTVLYLGTIIVGSLTFAWIFDATLAPLASHVHHHDHGGLGILSHVFGGVLVLAMVWFVSEEVRAFFRKRKVVTPDKPMLEIEVTGMTCNACVMGLERALSQVVGVEKTDVILESGKTTVLGVVERQAVIDAVRRAGFEVADTVTGRGG